MLHLIEFALNNDSHRFALENAVYYLGGEIRKAYDIETALPLDSVCHYHRIYVTRQPKKFEQDEEYTASRAGRLQDGYPWSKLGLPNSV